MTNAADAVKCARLDAGLTQAKLAEKTGINQWYIARLESAQYNPSVALLEQIAKALGKELVITLK